MTTSYRPPLEDPDLTADEAEGIRLALEHVDRGGELVDFDEVMDELGAELEALAQVRIRRAG